MSLYVDPTGHGAERPGLIEALMTIPATSKQHQLENQATTVLAWLVDRSRPFAHGILHLFVGHVPAASRIGARTQVALAKPGGGAVYPDLSIEGSDRAFQLLVEVKVDSEFGVHLDHKGRTFRQDAFYRHLWASRSTGEAQLRAVGTLTREGSAVTADLDGLRARDVSWGEIRELLERTDVAEDVALVAAGLREAIDRHLDPVVPDPSVVEAWLADNRVWANEIAAQLASFWSGSTTTNASGTQFAGRRVRFADSFGVPFAVRVYVSPAGGGLNLPAAPDALVVALEQDVDGRLDVELRPYAEMAGFARVRDIAKWVMHRRLWPLADVVSDPTGAAEAVAAALVATSVVPPPDAARSTGAS